MLHWDDGRIHERRIGLHSAMTGREAVGTSTVLARTSLAARISDGQRSISSAGRQRPSAPDVSSTTRLTGCPRTTDKGCYRTGRSARPGADMLQYVALVIARSSPVVSWHATGRPRCRHGGRCLNGPACPRPGCGVQDESWICSGRPASSEVLLRRSRRRGWQP